MSTINRLGIDVHPGLDVSKNLPLLIIDCTIAFYRNIEQEITVFTDNIHKHADYSRTAFVPIVIVCGLAVVPVANARASLPILRLHPVGDAALHIPKHSLLMNRQQLLASNNHLSIAARAPRAEIIVA